MTYPPSPAGSGTPRWTPGSRRRAHSCISSGSQDRTCPSAHVNRCQGGEESSGVSDSQTHTQRKLHLLPPGAAETRLLGKFPLSWDNNGSSSHAERPSDRVDKKIFHSRLHGSAVTLWLVSVSLIYKSSFFSTAQPNMEFLISHPLDCFSLFVRSCVSSPKDYSAATGDKLWQGPSRLTWSLY